MSHSNVGQTNFIGTHESVYRDSPIGKSEIFLVERMFSLQQGFEGNVLARISIGINFNSAGLASEQGIIPIVMSLSNSTAVGTELGRMPRINDVKCDCLVETSLDKVFFESEEGNPHDLSVESFSFWTESLEIFYRNIGVISDCHFGNVPDNFSDAVLHEIMLIPFGLLECPVCIGTSSVGIGLKDELAFKNLLSLDPDVLSEVVLMQNFAFRRNNRNSEAFAIDINPKDIPLLGKFGILFGQICDNLQTGSQTIGLASPSVFKKIPISVKIAVLHEWNSNPIFRVWCKFNKGHRFSIEWFGDILGYIESDSNASFGWSFASPYKTFNIADNIGMEFSGGLCG
jgi:hypothetical protein